MPPHDQAFRSGTVPYAGSGLFATRALAAGEPIIDVARPLLAVPDSSALRICCEWCFQGLAEGGLGQPGLDQGTESSLGHVTLKPCGGCRIVRYCGKPCQTQAWKHHHRYECRLYTRLYPRVLPNVSRMIIQLLLRKQYGALADAQWTSFLNLQSHIDDFQQQPVARESYENLQLMARAGREYAQSSQDLRLIETLVGRILINSVTLVTPIFHPLGLALDPASALINHSCTPNAAISFSGPVLSVRTLTAIPEDTQITISYIENSNPPHVRRLDLSSRYFFTCACPDCSAGQTLGLPDPPQALLARLPASELQSLDDQGADILLEAAVHRAAGRNSEYFATICRGLMLYHPQRAHYPPYRQPLSKLRADVTLGLLTHGHFLPALILSLQTYFAVDPVALPHPFHPLRVVHNYTLSKLAYHVHFLDCTFDKGVEALNAAMGVAEEKWKDVCYALLAEAARSVKRSHGEGSRLAAKVEMEVLAAMEVESARRHVGDGAPKNGLVGVEWQAIRRVADEGWEWWRGWAGRNRSLLEEAEESRAGAMGMDVLLG